MTSFCSADHACSACQSPMAISGTSIARPPRLSVSPSRHSCPTGERSSPQESSNAQRRSVFLGSLDSPAVTRVLPEPTNAVFSSRGYLLYGRQGALFAQRFDTDRQRLLGEPIIIGSGVQFYQATAGFAVAHDMVVWSSAIATPARLTWIDRDGKTLSTTQNCGRTAPSIWHPMSGRW